VVFQANIKVNTFSWSKIVKISFKRKQFFIQLRKEISESYDTLLGEQSYIILIRIIPLLALSIQGPAGELQGGSKVVPVPVPLIFAR
jgi:hypothetical protein